MLIMRNVRALTKYGAFRTGRCFLIGMTKKLHLNSAFSLDAKNDCIVSAFTSLLAGVFKTMHKEIAL